MKRFWDKVEKTAGCWLWLAARFANGDAMFRFEGRTQRAQRAAWVLSYGPIPPNKCVSQSCRNSLCVNPEHLVLTDPEKVLKARSASDRFWEKVQKTDGCWLWLGAKNRKGYGDFYVSRASHQQAHRFSWEHHRGPIPNGKQVCHSCDEPSCVNPDHLWLGTTQENTADMLRKGRHRFGADQPHDPLTGRFASRK